MPRRAPTFKPPSLGRPMRDESKKERDAFYSSARWMRLRAVFLAENPVCVKCLEGDRITPATIAHHRQERLACPRLALDPSNLVALCASCHTTLHKRVNSTQGGG